MEQNFDEFFWNNKSCPNYNCNKKCNCCGLEFVSIPAKLEEKAVPENGAYCNAIVRYEGSGKIYIYSKEGIPVLVKEGNAA